LGQKTQAKSINLVRIMVSQLAIKLMETVDVNVNLAGKELTVILDQLSVLMAQMVSPVRTGAQLLEI